MQSMTGFGSIGQSIGSLQIAVRLRSVNHRHLDLVVRMPEEIRALELEMRERIGKRFSRGRIELRVDLEDQRERTVEVRVNRSWIAGLQKASQELREAELDLSPLSLGDLLRNPDAVRISADADAGDDNYSIPVLAVLDEALDELEASRAKEGNKLQTVLENQLEKLSVLVKEISAEQPTIRQDQEERLRSRVQEVLGDSQILDEGRLEQEIVFLAERSDVREELDRLVTHLSHFREAMMQPGGIGKKLDFIAQEISRELTTLGAKCRQAGVRQRNVDAKLICEQIREQVQNIE